MGAGGGALTAISAARAAPVTSVDVVNAVEARRLRRIKGPPPLTADSIAGRVAPMPLPGPQPS